MLTDGHIQALGDRPRHEQARMLLRGMSGPLHEMGIDYGAEVAVVAYLLTLAWIAGRREQLGGRPGWEAQDMLASRVRAAASRSRDLTEFGSVLFRGVGARIDRLQPEDAIWWRQVRELWATPETWRRMRQRTQLEEALTASGLLREWLYAIREGEPT